MSYDYPWYHTGYQAPGIDYYRDIQPMDICMSAAYARAAEGDVLIFVRCGNDQVNNPGSVLWTTELPTYLKIPTLPVSKPMTVAAMDGSSMCMPVLTVLVQPCEHIDRLFIKCVYR